MFYIFLLTFIAVTDIYAYQLFKLFVKSKALRKFYIFFTLVVLGYLVYNFFSFNKVTGQNPKSLLAIGVFLTFYIPKLWIAIFLFIEDVGRVFFGLFTLNKFSRFKNKVSDFLPRRSKIFGYTALLAAVIHFSAFVHGIVYGRYKFRVVEQEVFFKNLPKSFDGFKVLQISDLHLGSLDNEVAIANAIELINKQEFDLFVFTGDLVNNKATETERWIPFIKKIKTPKYGKYSVLGNHDYGAYVKFDSDDQKAQNFQDIKDSHQKMDFTLMLNEHVYLNNASDSIALIGVENWGARFGEHGDIVKASKGIAPNDFKIVLSHDPSHFDLMLSQSDVWYDITLSGHTHGFQFGFELPNGFQWSPVSYVYKHWGGLYEQNQRFIYVNRGFGYHGYPGRVGVWPEITVLTLRSLQ